MRVRYWSKVVAAGTVLSALGFGVLGALGVGLSRLPERAQPWVVASVLVAAVITGMSALVHIWVRSH